MSALPVGIMCSLCVSYPQRTIQGNQMPWKYTCVNHHVGAGSQSQDLCKSSAWSKHLSDPKTDFLTVSVHVSSGASRGQRHLNWHLGGSVWVTKHGCWEPSVGPPEAQCVLLTAKPSLQPLLLLLVAHQIELVRSFYWRNHMHESNWNSAGSLLWVP